MLKHDVFLIPANAFQLYMQSRKALTKSIRKVKHNGSSLIGLYPSTKSKKMIQYESGLENEFIELVEFDEAVRRYQDQPIKIKYRDELNKQRTYTPDFIVYFNNNETRFKDLKPTIFEVKYSEELANKKAEFTLKFSAARNYARKNGMKFRVITEKEIHTTYQQNVNFLLGYRSLPDSNGLVMQIQDAFRELKEATPSEALALATNDRERRLYLIPALWHLLANRYLDCDLHTSTLTMETLIWRRSDKPLKEFLSPLYDI